MKKISPEEAPIVLVNEFKNFAKYNIVYKNDKEVVLSEEIDYHTFKEFIEDPNFVLVLESATLKTWKKVRYRKQNLFD